jgi:hypothetical protein
MKIFELDESYNVIFSPELFLLKDFRDLRDDRKDIDILYKEISYIYFFADLGSDFQFELNLNKRKKDLIRYVGLPPNWKPDKLVETCIEVYEYLSQTVSSSLLESVYAIVDKFQKQIKGIDLNERDKGGKPIWNQKQIMDMAKSVPDLLESTKKAEFEFLKDQEKETKIKGDKLKTLYEDGFKKLQMNLEE